MALPPRDRPAVAHLRRVWFKPTETFLHNALAGLARTRPLLLGYERAHSEAFPLAAPALALYPQGSLAARFCHWRSRRGGGDYHARFHHRRALRLLRRERARLLHAHFGYTGVHALPLRRRSGLPLVTSFYGEDASRLGRDPAWRERYAELFAEGERFLAEGPHMRERLLALRCPPEKVQLVPICIPVARYPFRARGAVPRGEPVRLFFCASFREKKGLRYALEAVARARRERPALSLRVGGDGPERAGMQELARGLGIGDCTEWLGFLPHARMLEEMHAADLFLQPSVTAANGDDEGGAPTTLLEAQACGLPVLATLHADIPHVVEHGESGLLSPERDALRLAGNLLELLETPERWAAMGESGRERMQRLHDVAVVVERLEDLYLELVPEATCSRA
jgi:colanic acid/amylovoran biosynthesis glycosyltransferase